MQKPRKKRSFGRRCVAILAMVVWTAVFFGQSSYLPANSANGPSSATEKSKSSKPWPKPIALIASIEAIQEIEATREWAQTTLQLLDLLSSCEAIDSSGNAIIFKQLEFKLLELDQLAVLASTRATRDADQVQGELSTELRRIGYRIRRRLAIWEPVYKLARQAASEGQLAGEGKTKAIKVTAAGARTIHFEGIDEAWHDYLQIPQTEEAFNSLVSKPRTRKKAARKLLSRIYSPVLSQEQARYVRTAIDEPALDFFKAEASTEVDYSRLLRHVELHEAKESGASHYLLNNDYQNLLWSTNLEQQKLASILDTHYRNANFRITISEKLLNRIVPEIPDMSEPISERILGARVIGRSRIKNKLRIDLIPDPERIHLQLETLGLAAISTTAVKRGFTIKNEGTSRYKVLKSLAIGRKGVSSDRPVAVSQTNSRLVGMRSKLDSVPVFGWIARRVALQQIEAQKPETDRFTRRKLERTAEQRMQEEVEKQLGEMTELVNQKLIQPLVVLEVDPEPVQMTTTPDMIVVRYRVAGRDQMAANTSRPRPLPDALMSFQVHQSVINNFLSRIGLNEKKFSPLELSQHLRRSMGQPEEVGGIDEDATLHFSSLQPIRVEFSGAQVKVELDLKSFQVGKGKTWRNLKIGTSFTPVVYGSTVVLNKTGHVNVSGKRLNLRDQIAIRTIFNSVFEDKYEINPFSAAMATSMGSTNLSIARMVIDNGWVGVSLGDQSGSQAPPIHHVNKPRRRHQR